MPFTPSKQSLDPETLEATQTAFDLAWTEIIAVPDAYDTELARNVLAKRIVQAALEQGERDPERLKSLCTGVIQSVAGAD